MKKTSKPPSGPTPMFFTRKGKLPTEEELEKMRQMVIEEERKRLNEQEQPPIERDKPMPKKVEKVVVEGKIKKQRKSLSNEQGIRMMREWDDKTVQEWANEFGVSYQTISKTVRIIRKKDASLCPPKKAKRRTLEDKVDVWIAMFKQGEGKK